MGLDDPFDDIFAEGAAKNNTRAGGKFQPKAKRGPTKKAENVPSYTSLQPVETGDSAQNNPSVVLQVAKPSEPQGLVPTDDERCLESVNPVENAASKGCVGHSVSAPSVPDFPLAESNSCLEKPAGESADVYLGLELLEDFLPQSTEVPETSDPPSEAPAGPASQNVEGRLPSSVISRVTDSECVSNIADDPMSHKLSPARDPLADVQLIISVDERDRDMHNGRLENEQIGSFSHVESLDVFDVITTSEPRAGKFQPKPKVQVWKERTEASTAKPDKMENVMGQMNAHIDPSEMQYIDKGLESAVPSDDVLDFSSFGLDQSILTEPTSELPADEQRGDLMEASQAEASTHEEHIEAVPAIHEKIATKRAKAGKNRNLPSSDLFPNQENASLRQDNEAGRVLRPRRKRMDGHQLVDESEGDEPNGELSTDYSGRSVSSEANDEEFQVENEPEVKKRRRKSNKAVGEKEKPVRKHKKAGEEPDQVTAVRPKKFSHSSTRKRRIVDKVLLETPEDEIDFQKVPLRDLIILADYKERIAKKEVAEAAGLGGHLNNQSAGTASTHHIEDEGFPTELGEETDDGQECPRIPEDSGYINYQTYMNKTPSTRWSNQDTELFYKAVQQFGTDLSMIQQLFPGRTRRQIRSKLKREESQHPFRLREALTNRANDHSYFQQVIEHLRQTAAENSKDESMSFVDDEEAEQIPETNEETAKSEQQTEQGTDVPVQSPAKEDYESEGDLFDWSEYKSEV